MRHPHVFVRLQLLRAQPHVEVIGFFEAEPTIAGRFAAESGLRRFRGVEELCELAPDIVVVEALDTEVPDLARQAAPHTRALLLEKPGAPDRSAMDALVRDLGRYPVSVDVGYELHFSEGVSRCCGILASDALGQVTLARFHCGCPVGCGAELWQSVPGDMGGVVFTEACHMVELILHTLGMPRSVQAIVQRLTPGELVRSTAYKADVFSRPGTDSMHRVGELMFEDVGAALLTYPDKLAVLDVTAWEATEWVVDWSMEYYGTNGTLKLIPNPPSVKLFLRQRRDKYPEGETYWEGGAPRDAEISLAPDPTYETELQGILQRLRINSPVTQEGLLRAQDVIHVLDAIYRSSQTGNPVEIGTPARTSSAKDI